MELREYFEMGLTVDAYADLLTEEQKKLHLHHLRRAKIDEESVEAVRSAGVHNILVMTEPWCGDSLAIFPVVSTLFSRAGGEVRVIRRDEHTELIDQYLTRDGRAIPIVLVLDEAYAERFRWGPRPAPAQQIVEDHREDVKAERIEKMEVHKMIRRFYGSDAGRTIIAEIVAKFRT